MWTDSSAGRAPRLHRGCRGFDPLSVHHYEGMVQWQDDGLQNRRPGFDSLCPRQSTHGGRSSTAERENVTLEVGVRFPASTPLCAIVQWQDAGLICRKRGFDSLSRNHSQRDGPGARRWSHMPETRVRFPLPPPRRCRPTAGCLASNQVMRVRIPPSVPFHQCDFLGSRRRSSRAATLSRWRKRVQVPPGVPFRDGVTAARVTLNHEVGVRIPVPEPFPRPWPNWRRLLASNQVIAGSSPAGRTTHGRVAECRPHAPASEAGAVAGVRMQPPPRPPSISA